MAFDIGAACGALPPAVAQPVSMTVPANIARMRRTANAVRRFFSPSSTTAPNIIPAKLAQIGIVPKGRPVFSPRTVGEAATTSCVVAACGPEIVTDAGVNWHVKPLGTDPQSKEIGPVNPFSGVAVMLNVADCPGWMVALVGV